MNFDFSILRKGVADLASQISTLRVSLERLKRQRDDLIAAPASKTDLKAAARKHLVDQQAAFGAVVRAQLDVFVRRPDRLANRELIAKQMTLLGATGKPGDSVASHRSMDVVLAGLFGPAITDAYLAAIDAMEFEEGPTNADRAIKLMAIEKEIAAMQQQLDELVSAARGIGNVIEA